MKTANERNINYLEAGALKSAGRLIDVKVTVKITAEKRVVVYMRDFEFHTYSSAARFIRSVGDIELRG